jgi:chaperonin GroEL
MAKKTIYGEDDSRAAILRGINTLADAVKITFGPKGRSILIEQKTGSPVVTRDGVTVAKQIELADRFENLGALAVCEAATKTADAVGDGTTTTTVLAQAMLREGFRFIAAGASPVAVKRGIERAVNKTVDRLRQNSQIFLNVAEAARIAALPSLADILKQEGLAGDAASRFVEENEKLKSRDLPIVSRLLLAAAKAGVEAEDADRVAARVLQAQAELNDTFGTLRDSRVRTLATIAAGNDHHVGALIATAVTRVGHEGMITVEESKTLDTFLEFIEGMQFDRGYLSPYFVTDPDRMTVALDQPFILLHEKKLSGSKELLPVLKLVAKNGKPLLVIAEDVNGDALSMLVVNKLRGTLKVAAVKAPAFGERRKEILADIAILTAGKVVSEDSSIKLVDLQLADLGRAQRVVIDRETTTVIGGPGSTAEIDGRVKALRAQIMKADSEYDREQLQARVAKLSSGVAVIRVGAATETEMKEKSARVEDAIHAIRAALEEGVGPGGGVAFVRCIRALEELETEDDEALGIRIVKRALEEPMRQIAHNAGHEGSVVVARVRENEHHNFGFNAASGMFTDLVEAGIIDPTKVTRLALQNAASVAGLLLMTGSMVAEVQGQTQEVRQPQVGFDY